MHTLNVERDFKLFIEMYSQWPHPELMTELEILAINDFLFNRSPVTRRTTDAQCRVMLKLSAITYVIEERDAYRRGEQF